MTGSGTLYIFKTASAAVLKVVPANLETGDVNASQPVFQAFVGGRPQFSADGKDLVSFSCGSNRGGPCTLSIRSMETGAVRDVSHTLGYMIAPRFSPDRQKIVVGGTDLKGRRGLYVIDLATRETTMLFAVGDRPTRPGFFDWSSDGTAIIYGAARNGQRLIVQRDIRSGEEKTLIPLPAECGGSQQLSPDRTLLACQVADASDAVHGILVAPLDGGTPRVVYRTADGTLSPQWVWAPDNQGVIVGKEVAPSTEELWMVPFDGTPIRMKVETATWAGPFFSVHPNGRLLAFTARTGATGAEIWALENLLPAASAKR
jgi:hypothetical protein